MPGAQTTSSRFWLWASMRLEAEVEKRFHRGFCRGVGDFNIVHDVVLFNRDLEDVFS